MLSPRFTHKCVFYSQSIVYSLIAQNVVTHPGLFLVVAAKIQTI